MSYTVSKAKLEAEILEQKNKKKLESAKKAGKQSITPLLVKQFEELNMNIRDEKYSAIYDKVVDDNYNRVIDLEHAGHEVIRKVVMMQRRIAISQKDHKKFEALSWHEDWVIEDTASIEFQKGVDYKVSMKPEYDSEGAVSYKPTNKTPIYTVPFSKEKVNEILNQEGYQTDIDNVQLSIITGNGKDFSPNNLTEFCDCSLQELEFRNRTGFLNAGYPSDYKFSELSPAERFKLEQGKK